MPADLPCRSSSVTLGVLAILAAASSIRAADPPDGIALGVVTGPAAGQVTLTWTGGVNPYRVYGSATAATITGAGSFLGETPSTVWIDTPPAGKVYFYRVVMCTAGADCASSFCADGWCCTSDCSLACEACNLPGTEGVCTFVLNGTDPAAECPGGETCDGTGACRPDQQPNGAACGGPGECASGFCTDGVCCESACGGTCEACNLPGRGGFCDPVAAGTDPASECVASPVSTCGTTGNCSGGRSCQLYAAGTICAAAACSSTQSQRADQCDGAGTCVDLGVLNCAPYLCNGATGLCLTSCTSSANCAAGFGCNVATGQCLLS